MWLLPTHLYIPQIFTHSLLAHHHLCYVDVYCACTINLCVSFGFIAFALFTLSVFYCVHLHVPATLAKCFLKEVTTDNPGLTQFK